MNISDILYNIIIRPVELLLGILTRILIGCSGGNIPLLLPLLSLAVFLLTLPMYRRAEQLEAEERRRRDALQPLCSPPTTALLVIRPCGHCAELFLLYCSFLFLSQPGIF